MKKIKIKIKTKVKVFPILGGRLLKDSYSEIVIKYDYVSNPWREAIEVITKILKK